MVFSVQGKGGSPTGPDPENRVGDHDIGSPGRPVSSGLQVPGEPGHCRARTRPPWELPTAFFLQNVLHLHQQRWLILRDDSLALWEIINEKDAVLIPKNRGEYCSSAIFALGIFGARLTAMTPLHWLLLCLQVIVIQPGFVHGHQSRQEVIWIEPKNSRSCSDDWHLWRFWSSFRHFGTHFAESFRMSKSSWMMDVTRSREMPSCSAIDLAEMWQFSKISSSIWSIISGVVSVLCRPGRGASQVAKSPRLN